MQEIQENGKEMEDIIKGFHTNWDLHPYLTMLIRKDRTIMAVNRVGESLGIPVGVKCFQLTKKERICPGCQADKALKENRGIQVGSYQAHLKQFIETFWVPLDGVEDVYLHYGNDISQWVKDELKT